MNAIQPRWIAEGAHCGMYWDPLSDRRQRQRHVEQSASSFAFAAGAYASTVQLYDVTHDGKPEPEAAVPSCESAVTLSKSVEHVRKEVLADSLARIGHGNDCLGPDSLQPDFDRTAVRRELDRIRQKIPDHLLDSTCIPQYDSDVRLDTHRQVNAFRIGRKPESIYRGFNHRC